MKGFPPDIAGTEQRRRKERRKGDRKDERYRERAHHRYRERRKKSPRNAPQERERNMNDDRACGRPYHRRHQRADRYVGRRQISAEVPLLRAERAKPGEHMLDD